MLVRRPATADDARRRLRCYATWLVTKRATAEKRARSLARARAPSNAHHLFRRLVAAVDEREDR